MEQVVTVNFTTRGHIDIQIDTAGMSDEEIEETIREQAENILSDMDTTDIRVPSYGYVPEFIDIEEVTFESEEEEEEEESEEA